MIPLLTIEDVMRQLTISRKTAYALIRRGELEAARIGKSWRVSQAAVEAFVASARLISQPAVRVPLQPSRRTRRRQQRVKGAELQVTGADYFLKRHGAN